MNLPRGGSSGTRGTHGKKLDNLKQARWSGDGSSASASGWKVLLQYYFNNLLCFKVSIFKRIKFVRLVVILLLLLLSQYFCYFFGFMLGFLVRNQFFLLCTRGTKGLLLVITAEARNRWLRNPCLSNRRNVVSDEWATFRYKQIFNLTVNWSIKRVLFGHGRWVSAAWDG